MAADQEWEQGEVMGYNLDNLYQQISSRPTNGYGEVRDLHWLLVALALVIELRALRRVLNAPVYHVSPSGQITSEIGGVIDPIGESQ